MTAPFSLSRLWLLSLLTGLTLMLLPFKAQAQNPVNPNIEIQAALDADKVVIAQWWTDWCPTCQRQKRVIADLRAANDYPGLHFVEIDHDVWGQTMMAAEQGVVRRSTLVAITPDGILDIQIAQTGVETIQGFINNAQMVSEGNPPLEHSATPGPRFVFDMTPPDTYGETCTVC